MKKAEILRSIQERLPYIPTYKRDSILPEKAAEVGRILHTEEDIEDSKCGIGSFKPKWLQHFARKEAYILAYCLIGMTKGMFFTYTVSVLTTIEKRFKLTSKQSGIFLAGNDISQIILTVFLSYYGNYGHRPRWIGNTVMIAAVSGFAAALPHFIYGPGQDAVDIVEMSRMKTNNGVDGALSILGNTTVKEKEQELCFLHPEETCGVDDAGNESYLGPLIIFFISQFFVGLTNALFYSIGVTYLDDNVNKKVYPIYYALAYMLRVLGPIAGFFVGGKCLSVWIDPKEQPNLTKKDPRWYGAWWIGYLFIGCNLLVCGVLMILFPRKLPATLRRETKKVVRQARKDEQVGNNRGIEYFVSLKTKKESQDKPTLKNLRKAFKRLFTNKIWVATMFNTVVAVFAGASYWYFKPKYLESQFRKSSSESSYYTGLVALISLLLGTGVGGSVMRWIHPRPRFVAAYNIFITCVTTSSYIIKMFVGCPKLDVVGLVDGNIQAPACSGGCGCSDRFTPMCSQDGSTLFYSPCFAGCTVANTSASPIVYSDCHCISNVTDTLNYIPSNNTLQPASFGYGVSGYCDEPCDTFVYFIVIETVVRIIEASARVGNSLIYMRCSSDEDKSLSLALMTVFLSMFAFIPAPIVMGAIVDSVCLVWDKTCGKYGNCWFYDSDKQRYIIHLVPAALVLISILGDIVVYYYSDTLDLYGEKDNNIDVGQIDAAEVDEMKPLNREKDEKVEGKQVLNGGNETPTEK